MNSESLDRRGHVVCNAVGSGLLQRIPSEYIAEELLVILQLEKGTIGEKPKGWNGIV